MRELMKDLGGVLRPLGWRGAGGVWRLQAPDGVAVIERQGSAGSGPRETLFYIDTAVVPVIWWEWLHHSQAPPPTMDRVRESHGLRLIEGRVEPTEPGGHRWRL